MSDYNRFVLRQFCVYLIFAAYIVSILLVVTVVSNAISKDNRSKYEKIKCRMQTASARILPTDTFTLIQNEGCK